ncbi:MAG: hypothetical protein WBL68_06815 [Nitrososphaeraceae archaeon]
MFAYSYGAPGSSVTSNPGALIPPDGLTAFIRDMRTEFGTSFPPNDGGAAWQRTASTTLSTPPSPSVPQVFVRLDRPHPGLSVWFI